MSKSIVTINMNQILNYSEKLIIFGLITDISDNYEIFNGLVFLSKQLGTNLHSKMCNNKDNVSKYISFYIFFPQLILL